MYALIKIKLQKKAQSIIELLYSLHDTIILHAGFILECGFAGFPQFQKKSPHKIFLGMSNRVHKIVPKDKYLFSEIKEKKHD